MISKLAKAVATINKNKLHSLNEYIRFNSAVPAKGKAVQFKFTLLKWVKSADTVRLYKFLRKEAVAKVKIDNNVQEFKDSNVAFIFTYCDSINNHRYSFAITPADYK